MGVKVREKVPGSGVWWVYTYHNGGRTANKIGDKRTAKRFARLMEEQLRLGKYQTRVEAPTLERHFQHFTRTYLNTAVRESTRMSYEGNFRVHILPALGHKRINQIRRTEVKEFVASLVGKGLAKPTIRIITAQLCALLNQAKEDGLLTDNPATKLSKFYKNAQTKRKEVEPLTREEVVTLLNKAREWCPRYYPTFFCAIHTGLRTGELIGLQWVDIDFFNKWIVVRRSVVRRRVQETKTSKIRRVDLSDALLKVLTDLKKQRKEEWLVKGQNEIPKWVFCSQNGNFMDPYNLKDRYFYKCLEKAGLRRIRFHDLRHTFATLLIEQGHPLAYIQQQLGHASIKMTVDVYGHLAPGSNRQAVNSLPTLDQDGTYSHLAATVDC